MKILFVCLGNICRSPMAEFVLKEKVRERGLSEKVTVESAATSRWEIGRSVHHGTREQLKLRGISTNGKTARQVVAKDFSDFDCIIGMDEENVCDLQRLAPENARQKICLFLDILPNKKGVSVPDPYYTGNFEETYALVEQGCTLWLEKILLSMNGEETGKTAR